MPQGRRPAGAPRGIGGQFTSDARRRAESNLTAWPAIGGEVVPWDITPLAGMSRRERAMIGRSYRAAVPAEIATSVPSIAPAIMADVEDAATELARFDADMGSELAPYAAVLLRSEAASSSRIEGITAGARAVMEAEATGVGGGNAAQVYANTMAMRAALAVSGALDESAILAMHTELLHRTAPHIAGRLRDEQVWIGADNTPHTAEFVPPVAARVARCLKDLVAFMGREDLPVVVQVAIAHAQFETIHPFPDGNGRTGRALMHSMLRAKGITRNTAVPVSAGLLVRRAAYVDALTAYREGDVDPIVQSVATACLTGVGHARELVRQTRHIRNSWNDRLSSVRSDSGAHRLADGIIGQPVITVAQARAILGQDANVHRRIQALVDRGILLPHQDYRTRNMTWRAQDVLDALDDYSERVGRRTR